MGLCGQVCLYSYNASRKKERVFVALFFLNSPPYLRVHRGLKEVLVLKLDEGDAEMKT